MSEEREGTRQGFARMFGVEPKQEPDEPMTPAADAKLDDDRAMQSADHPNRHLSGLFAADAHKRQRDAEWLARLHRPREDGD